MEKCTICKKELQPCGGVGGLIDGVTAWCPDDQLFYKDGEAVAVQRGNTIFKLDQ